MNPFVITLGRIFAKTTVQTAAATLGITLASRFAGKVFEERGDIKDMKERQDRLEKDLAELNKRTVSEFRDVWGDLSSLKKELEAPENVVDMEKAGGKKS